MAIGRLRKEKSKSLREVDIDAFIQQGGSTKQEEVQNSEVRMTLRIPSEIVEQLDKIRKRTPGFLSRNTLIIQLLQKGLEE